MKTIFIIGSPDSISERHDLVIALLKGKQYSCIPKYDNIFSFTKTEHYQELTLDAINKGRESRGYFPKLLDTRNPLMIIFCLGSYLVDSEKTSQALSNVIREAVTRNIFLVLAMPRFIDETNGNAIDEMVSLMMKSIIGPTVEKEGIYNNKHHSILIHENILKIDLVVKRFVNTRMGINEPANISEFLQEYYNFISFEHKRDLYRIMNHLVPYLNKFDLLKKDRKDHFEKFTHLSKFLNIFIPNDIIASIYDFIRSDCN